MGTCEHSGCPMGGPCRFPGVMDGAAVNDPNRPAVTVTPASGVSHSPDFKAAPRPPLATLCRHGTLGRCSQCEKTVEHPVERTSGAPAPADNSCGGRTVRPKVGDHIVSAEDWDALCEALTKATGYDPQTILGIISGVDTVIAERDAARAQVERVERVRSAVDRLDQRRNDQRDWLAQRHPAVFTMQDHLDEGSVAQIYWHAGSQSALGDAVELLRLLVGDKG